MFKKGFLGQHPNVKVVERPLPALPGELIEKVLDELAILCGPGFQRDVANLRLANKFLRDVATPYFYRSIEVGNRLHAEQLARQLHARPKLWQRTHAVWWDEKVCGPGLDKVIDIASRPYLVKFDNLEELSFCARFPSPGNPEVPVAWQYALRDYGPWCEGVDWDAHLDKVGHLQTTPSLTVKCYPPDALVEAQIRHDRKRKRLVWAIHVVAPSFSAPAYTISKTCTHLTVTLYEYPMMPDMQLRKHLDQILGPQYPLLQYLHVRLISFGARPNGLPNKEDIPAYHKGMWPTDPSVLARSDAEEWAARAKEIKQVLLSYKDKRTSFETIVLSGVQSKTRYEDVRKFMRNEWRERVWGRPGPWPKPPTQEVPRPARFTIDVSYATL